MPVRKFNVSTREGFVESLQSKLTASLSVVRYQYSSKFGHVKVELAPLMAEAAARKIYDVPLSNEDALRYRSDTETWKHVLSHLLMVAWRTVLNEHVPNNKKLTDQLAEAWAINLSGFLSRDLDPQLLV